MQYVDIKQHKHFLVSLHDLLKKRFILCEIIFLILISLFLLSLELVKPYKLASNKLIFSNYLTENFTKILKPFYNYPNIAFNEILEVYNMKRALNKLQVALKEAPSKAAFERLNYENDQLKKLLNYHSSLHNFKMLTTRIVGGPIRPFASYVILPVGKDHYLEPHYAVINNEGLVGKIVEVGDNFSKVQLTTEINFRVPVITTQSNYKAIAAGQNSDLINLLYLPEKAALVAGEFIITTGELPFFPEGLEVGRLDTNLKIIPNFSTTQLDFVMVLLP